MKALAITSAAIAGLLVVAMAVFILRPDPLGGEPFALLQIDTTARPDPAERLAIARNRGDAEQTPPAAGNTAPAESKPPREERPVKIVSARAEVALPSVPDKALIENSRYGPLPKIAADGRRPSEIYARPSSVTARPEQGEPARVAILINGLGLSEQVTTDAIANLPGPVTLAFGPYGRNLQGWVRQAREAGHEVMLQIPLEPFDYPDNDPGPQTLLTSLTPEENQKRLFWLLARFTGYTGVTNHMGAKFAAAQDAFLPVLEELRSRGLIYVDDGTSARSTAGAIARELGLGFSVAQVQLDAEKTAEGVEAALGRLERIALENGFAIGVGTSLPVTIEQVAKWWQDAGRRSIVLIPVSAAVLVRHPS